MNIVLSCIALGVIIAIMVPFLPSHNGWAGKTLDPRKTRVV